MHYSTRGDSNKPQALKPAVFSFCWDSRLDFCAALEFEGHPSVSVDTEKLKTVTPNSVIHYHAVIYQALKYAMKTDMVPQNVAMKVDRPRKNSFQPTFLDAEQMQKLFEVVKGTRLELPVLVAAFYWADHDQQIPGALCGGH